MNSKGTSGVEETPSFTPFQPEEIETLSPPAIPTRLWIAAEVPFKLAEVARGSGLELVTDPADANLLLGMDKSVPAGSITWVYAFVAPFPTQLDGMSLEEIKRGWAGDASSRLQGVPIWMEASTLAALTNLWGPPNQGLQVKTSGPEDILASAWAAQPAFAIIPFEEVEPRWKVLTVDGQSPLRKEFNPETYPLTIYFSLTGPGRDLIRINLPVTNLDPARMTRLVMTGVTAMVRATALKMENKSRTYPGEAVHDWLAGADITHISNEIPFSNDCPFPDAFNSSLIFCSDPKNIELLEYIGTDVVELTGNHLQDWGSAATLFTINMYNQRGWPYFGGGINQADARKSITIEHNGNKIAFIGCNPAGPVYAWATETEPGAASCDWDFMTAEVKRLRAEGILPIVTFQYYEGYSAWPDQKQVDDFRKMADAGAVIVSGSQAHYPMTMEFHESAFIHYGLGNLFFDQMDYPVVGTRREFIDRHIFYNGKYINTELLTAMLEDYARPRPMTEEERRLFLGELFDASGW